LLRLFLELETETDCSAQASQVRCTRRHEALAFKRTYIVLPVLKLTCSTHEVIPCTVEADAVAISRDTLKGHKQHKCHIES
jgi:hypothetical protein